MTKSEKNSLYNKRYRERHKDKVKAYRLYYKNTPQGKLSAKKARKRWRIKNREKHRIHTKAWSQSDKGRVATIKYRYKINLTSEEYRNLIIKHNDLCGICKKKEVKKSLAIDHDHKTGKVRGLLCQKCNRGLGLFDDNKELLENALHYLS